MPTSDAQLGFDEPFFHVGIVVEDLDAAMAELGAALKVSWGAVIARSVGEWSYRIVYSITGPPHIELIEGAPGSPWDPAGGSRLDHVGWWVDDSQGEKERLEAVGIGPDADLRELGSALYLRAPSSGLRIELNTGARKTSFYERLAEHDASKEEGSQ